MDEIDFHDAEFVVGWCTPCAREVLTHGEYDVTGVELRFCVGCDELVSEQLRAVKGQELADLGYAEVDPQGGGCGREGCGGGACGRR